MGRLIPPTVMLGTVLSVAAGCGEARSPFESPGVPTKDSLAANETKVIAKFLAESTVAGNCQVLHLFGSPNWVETGLCAGSSGAQCVTSHPAQCFNGRT